jgi:hypothetical protein
MQMTQQDFIYEQLADWGAELEDKLRAQLQSMNIGVTGELLRSLSYQVIQTPGDDSARIEISFAEWGRMVDMGAGRGHKIGGVEGARNAILNKSRKLNGRPAKKFYSKTAYGMLGRLAYRIENNYTEAVIASVVGQLKTTQ